MVLIVSQDVEKNRNDALKGVVKQQTGSDGNGRWETTEGIQMALSRVNNSSRRKLPHKLYPNPRMTALCRR